MFPGMPMRLQSEIRQRYYNEILKGDETRVNKCRIQVEAPIHRSNNVFNGGSILADLMKNRDEFWLSKNDYEDLGVDRALASLQQ